MKSVTPLLGLLLALQDPGQQRPAASAANVPSGGAATARAPRIHLVELFTSQACHDCPPADALVSNLDRHGIPADQAVAIAWHVDLWDDDTFKDPYAVKGSGRRHRDYARTLGCATYTPMAVIDGRSHVVGSNRKALLRALAGRGEARIRLSATVEQGGTAQPGGTAAPARVRIAVAGAAAAEFEDLELLVVLVEDGITTRIAAGENAGKELTANSVVRLVLKQGTLKQLGGELWVPIDVSRAGNPTRCSVVAFVQDAEGEVLQVVRSPVPAPAPAQPVSQVEAPQPPGPASRPAR